MQKTQNAEMVVAVESIKQKTRLKGPSVNVRQLGISMLYLRAEFNLYLGCRTKMPFPWLMTQFQTQILSFCPETYTKAQS